MFKKKCNCVFFLLLFRFIIQQSNVILSINKIHFKLLILVNCMGGRQVKQFLLFRYKPNLIAPDPASDNFLSEFDTKESNNFRQNPAGNDRILRWKLSDHMGHPTGSDRILVRDFSFWE